MSTDRDRLSPPTPGTRLAEVVTILACVVLCAATVADFARWRSQREELSRTLDDFGTRLSDEQVRFQVLRERVSHHARLAVARSLVSDVLSEPSGLEDAPPSILADRLARLATGRREARRALREQPGNARAWTLLGASIYLERSLTASPELVTRHADWEVPLLAAVAASTVATEPRRFLAAAYLECWPSLSSAKQASGKKLLRDLFRRDAAAFSALAGQWIAVAGDPPEAFEVIPDRPQAWRFLERTYASTGDWSAFRGARERHLGALEDQLDRDLDEAAERLRLGDPDTARQICLRVAATAPPSRRFATRVNLALELYPPGLQGRRFAEPLREWLLWALRLDALGLTPLTPRTASALTDAVGELEPPVAAHAALLAGDDYRRRLAEQSLVSGSKAWTSYLIAKARRLATHEPVAASKVLERVSRPARSRIDYWLARAEVARGGGDRRRLDEAEEALAARRAARWTLLDWHLEGEVARLWLLPAAPASGLELELVPDIAESVAAEVTWDGEVLAVVAIRRGETLDVDIDVGPGLHLLEVRGLAGGRVTPAAARLAER